MRVAALIFGILGGLSGLVLSGYAHIGVAVLSLGGLPQEQRAAAIIIIYGIPITGLVGAGLALTSPRLAALLMFGSALGWFFIGKLFGSVGSFLTFGPMLFSGIGAFLAAAAALGVSNSDAEDQQRNNVERRHSGPSLDRARWNALVAYDPDISTVAEKLNVLGSKWVDKFASDYLAINDKAYLLSIAKKVIEQAQAEQSAVEQEMLRLEATDRERAEARSKQYELWKFRLWGTWPRRSAVAALIICAVGGIGWQTWGHYSKLAAKREAQRKFAEETKDYSFNLGVADPPAMRAFQAVIPDAFKKIEWLYGLKGVGRPMKKVTIENRIYLLGFVCKPHDCGANNVVFLAAEDGSSAMGELVIHRARFVLGSPTPTEERMLVSNLR